MSGNSCEKVRIRGGWGRAPWDSFQSVPAGRAWGTETEATNLFSNAIREISERKSEVATLEGLAALRVTGDVLVA